METLGGGSGRGSLGCASLQDHKMNGNEVNNNGGVGVVSGGGQRLGGQRISSSDRRMSEGKMGSSNSGSGGMGVDSSNINGGINSSSTCSNNGGSSSRSGGSLHARCEQEIARLKKDLDLSRLREEASLALVGTLRYVFYAPYSSICRDKYTLEMKLPS
jgi:hypothetical protein